MLLFSIFFIMLRNLKGGYSCSDFQKKSKSDFIFASILWINSFIFTIKSLYSPHNDWINSLMFAFNFMNFFSVFPSFFEINSFVFLRKSTKFIFLWSIWVSVRHILHIAGEKLHFFSKQIRSMSNIGCFGHLRNVIEFFCKEDDDWSIVLEVSLEKS